MNEVRELKEHVRWLEDEVGSVDHIEEQLDEIKDVLGNVGDTLKGMCDMFERVCVVLTDQNHINRKLVEALQHISSSFEASTSAAAKQPDVFDQILKEAEEAKAKRPKRQKFKPKVVVSPPEVRDTASQTPSDQPDADPPPAA